MKAGINAILVGTMAALAGCTKSSTEPVATAADAAPTAEAGVVQAGFEDVSKKLQSQQYDAAVGTLIALQGMPKSDTEQAAYMNQVRQANDALAARARAGDENARASQRMLGKFMTGR